MKYEVMKKLLLFSIVILAFVGVQAQTINNSGTKVVIPDGTYVIFNNLINTGSGAEFNYNNDLTISGNWTNSNSAVFTSGANSSVIFNGTAQQTITSGGSQFRNVVINNTSTTDYAIILGDDMSISAQLTLTDGVINAGMYQVKILNGATSGIGNTGSYVDGVVAKTGTVAFTFPVGDGLVWAPVGIAAPSTSSTISAQYTFSEGPLNWSASYMCDESQMQYTSGVEHWDMATTSATPAVTLYWKNGTRSGITDLTDLAVAHFNGTCWEYMEGTTTGSVADGTITSTLPFSSYSPVSFGSKNRINPLPIELLSFSSTCSGFGVDLEWVSASESNSYGYYIEKSLDAVNFKEIGFIGAAGNSNQLLNYSFTDENVEKQAKYYRLRMVDVDGQFKYSSTIVAFCYEAGAPVIMVYPNPFKDDLNIIGENFRDENTIIYVYDMLGKIIAEYKVENLNGSFSQIINIHDLSPAMYTVKIISGSFNRIVKVTKEQ